LSNGQWALQCSLKTAGPACNSLNIHHSAADDLAGLPCAHKGIVAILLAWTFFGAERAPSVVRSRPGFRLFHYLFWPLQGNRGKALITHTEPERRRNRPPALSLLGFPPLAPLSSVHQRVL